MDAHAQARRLAQGVFDASLQTVCTGLQGDARLTGGLAIWLRCARSRHLVGGGRNLRDIDLVAPLRFRKRLEAFLIERFMLHPNPFLAAIPGAMQSRFLNETGEYVVDLYYDRLEYCHTIDLSRRLEVDEVTIPLAELLISKLQIIDLTEKDLIDVACLLIDHELADADGATINTSLVSELYRHDWGLERTSRYFLHRLRRFLKEKQVVNQVELLDVMLQIGRLLELLDLSKKSIPWRLRGLVGESVRWYEIVEPLPESAVGGQ